MAKRRLSTSSLSDIDQETLFLESLPEAAELPPMRRSPVSNTASTVRTIRSTSVRGVTEVWSNAIQVGVGRYSVLQPAVERASHP